VVPFTGHSVLGDDPSSCSSNALKALFSGAPIEPCRKIPTPSSLRPQKRPPLGLSGLSPAGGRRGLTGRTAHAIELTISDLKSQLLLELEASGDESLFSPSGLRTGGLRSGWASLNKEGLKLHDYSFVPGLTLSGAIKSEVADLRIGGPKAAHGVLRLGRRHALVGRLDGQSVDLPATSQASAAIVGADATASTNRDTRRPVLDRLTGGLGGPLARLLEP
jgi:hypothetical protein